MSSTPIYDELAATYLADLDFGALEHAEQATGRRAGGTATPPPPADPQSGERANA
ncbi:hypothetical protein [Saccharothrix australiensis]|uniref:hypothetical protein n=1 Tax=Saccharothrix australiensis TaxID=2072 RepID=UPI0014774204|nr:hypothetical protein [Saccharothrix australiensis]